MSQIYTFCQRVDLKECDYLISFNYQQNNSATLCLIMKWLDVVGDLQGSYVRSPSRPRLSASIRLLYLHLGVITRVKVWRFDTRQIDSFTATAGPGGDNEVED